MSYYTSGKDPRDLTDKTIKPEMFAFVSPSTSPKTIIYIEKSKIELMKKVHAPLRELSGDGGNFNCSYYRNEEGRYAGSASFSHYLKAPEIVEELMKDEEFVKTCVERNATWFFPEAAKDMFIF